MKKYLCCVVALFSVGLSTFAAVPIKSDPAQKTSFPFSIQQHVFDAVFRLFFVGAHEEIENEEDKLYALSYAGPSNSMFVGIAPEKIMLNDTANVDNPMHGAAISHLALLGPDPIVVTQKQPQNLYIVQNFMGGHDIVALSAEGINDADGKPTAGIAALATNASRKIFYLPESMQANEKHNGSTIYAAVSKEDGVFGEKGSGIAVVGVQTITDDETKKSKNVVNIINAQTGESDGNIAKPFDSSVPELFIEKPAEKLENFITFYSSMRHGLYIGVQQAAGADESNGIRSVLMAYLTGSGIEYKSIAPESAFSSNDKIVGAVGSGEQVSIHQMTGMLTSTWLDYLIVVGGNGDSASTADHVYALPIVHNRADMSHGQIANKNSIPVSHVRIDDRFSHRSFVVPATTPDEMPLTTDDATRVGGGPLGAPINEVFTTLDTVFVATDKPVAGQQPGIFYSQALFDQFGRIAKWTPWQRAGAVGQIFGLSFDPGSANFTFTKGNNPNEIDMVQRTSFGKVGFSKFLTMMFEQDEGGVQGMVEFPFQSDGFSQISGERLSVMLWQGNKKVVLSQIGGDDEDGNFGPIKLDRVFESTNGTLHGFSPTENITNIAVSGGDLSKIGPCITAEKIILDGQGYFFVGGFGGIAVLADQHGNGFDANHGLRSRFAGLHEQMHFKKLGDFSHVRKLICDNNTLYVLTDEGLERVVFTPQDIMDGIVTRIKVTDKANLSLFGDGDTFSDALVSNGFGIVATSAGIYFASGLENATHESNVRWQYVELNDSTRSSTRLIPLSSQEGFDKKGMVLVLNAYIGLSYANIYRLIIDSDDLTEPVKKVPDIFYTNDSTSFFFSIGLYRNYVVTDGAIWFVMRSKYLDQESMFQLYTPGLRSGLALPERMPVPFYIDNPADSRAIGPMIRSKTSGNWLVVGDFGIRGNE